MTRISIEDFPEKLYGSTRCFHTSGITLALSEACRKTGVEMIRRFKEQGALISFDVNFRGNLWSGEEARECIEGILPYVDIFFCSEDTARLTFHKEGTVKEMMRSFAKEYPLKVIASTQRTVHSPKVHSFTSVIYQVEEDKFYEEKPYQNIEVVDRIGSGDAYISGVLYGLLSSHGDCQKALEYGNASSAAKNTIPGDMPSLNQEEIEDIIADHKNTGYHSEMKR
jgi:2-dehydro-3-deoxygluconokinase